MLANDCAWLDAIPANLDEHQVGRGILMWLRCGKLAMLV